jgi:hypothetical protein
MILQFEIYVHREITVMVFIYNNKKITCKKVKSKKQHELNSFARKRIEDGGAASCNGITTTSCNGSTAVMRQC